PADAASSMSLALGDAGDVGRPAERGDGAGDQRPDQHDDGECGDGADQRIGEEHQEIAVAGDQRLAEGRFRALAQHQRKDHRRQGVVELLEDIADDAEDQHQYDVEIGIVDGEGADGTDHDDDRGDDGEGDAQDGGEERHGGQHHDQADEIGDVEAGDEAPDEVLLLDEQHRAGLETPDEEAAEQHGGGRGAGNPQGQHGQHGAGAGGMSGGLGSEDAFDLAPAEIL